MRAQWRVLLVFCAACGQKAAPEKLAQADAVLATAPSPATRASRDTTPWRTGPIWFLQSRALDLTGDGILDTLLVEARGTRTDSMHIVLGAVVSGDTSILALWDGNYELTDEQIDRRGPEPELQTLLRSRLTTVLHSVWVAPFDGAGAIGEWSIDEGEADCIQSVESCVRGSIEYAVRDSLLPVAAPFDTVRARRALSDLRTPGRVEVDFRYGYESSERVVWSPVLRRFLTVFSCC